jgi:hypothetical protein
MVTKPLRPDWREEELNKSEIGIGRIKLPPRTEIFVKLPAEAESVMTEGLVEKRELAPGVYLAGSLVRIMDGSVITSILNTTEIEVDIPKPVIRITETEKEEPLEINTVSPVERDPSWDERVMEQLRTEHLNQEERESLWAICFDYQDVFFLQGDRLSSTTAAKYTIRLEPGTVPINTRPYRLPESQKHEIESQVTKLLEEGIIEESNSPWNSPILVVP